MSKRAIVVTGASSGIGAEIARRLAEPQRHLVVHYHANRRGAEQTAAAVEEAGATCDLVAADIGTDAGRAALLATAARLETPIEAWINMAGADVLTGSARDYSFEEKLDLLYRVDVRGTLLLAKAALPLLRGATEDGFRPSMLFVGWDQAFEGMEGDAGELFCPIKAAVMAFSRSLAHNAAPAVRVNCVAPGWIKTAWGEGTSEYWDHRARSESLSNRWGTPSDIAAAVQWLVSSESDFVNGQIVNLNGGWRRAEAKS